MKQTAHKGHNAKHAGTHKHTQGKGKHHPAKAHKAQTHHHAHQKQHAHTAAKGPKVAKPRKLAQSSRPAGEGRQPVATRLDGFERRGLVVPPAAALADISCCAAEALAWSLRLAGWPVGAADVLALYKLTADSPDAGASVLATLDAAYLFGLAGVRPVSFARADLDEVPTGAKLILGLELPGPHAVCQQDGQWWTWGEPYDPCCFPDAVIEEAWAVTWP